MGPFFFTSSSFDELYSGVSLGAGASIHWADLSQQFQPEYSIVFSTQGYSVPFVDKWSAVQSIEWAQHSYSLEIGSFDFSNAGVSFSVASNLISSPIPKPVESPTILSISTNIYSGDISVDTSWGEFSGTFSASGGSLNRDQSYSSFITESASFSCYPVSSFSHSEYSYVDISSAQRTWEPSAITTPAPSVPLPTAVIVSVLPSESPTSQPSMSPVAGTGSPTMMSSAPPTLLHTVEPTLDPSKSTTAPFAMPSNEPTLGPSTEFTPTPTKPTTVEPTLQPSKAVSTVTPTSTGTPPPLFVSPTERPTVTPTVAPSTTPTLLPNAAPTRLPTRMPSVVPTVGPSVAPSIIPTVRPGRTQNPSRAPTAAPSLSEEALWRLRLAEVLATAPDVEAPSVAHQSLYHELDVASASPSTAVYGSCSGWRSFLNGDLTTSKFLYQPTSIALTVQQSLSGGVSTLRCDNATIVSQLLSALTDATSAVGAIKSFQCSDQRWVVSTCTVGVPSLCVNCADPCSTVSHCATSTNSAAASPFSISPCVSSVCPVGSKVASGMRLLSLAYKDFVPAPSIVSRTVSSTRTSLTVNAKLSDRGSVYCAAYPFDETTGETVAPTSTGALMLQNFVATATAANDSSVTISGLSAATRFQVYCMTVSRAGTKMAIDKVVAQSTTAFTACCIPIVAQSGASTVIEGANVANFLSVSLSNRPAVDVTVKLNVFNAQGRAIVPTPFFPSTFTLAALQQGSFGSSSVNKAVLFSASMLALPMGSYYYNITTTGSSAKQYDVSFVNNANTITVLSSVAPLPAPALSSAIFADDGSYVAISFDANTDKGKTSTQFTCSALFSFACASTSTCVWSSSKMVNAIVNSAAGCATVDFPVSLSSTAVVKALCQSTTGTCDTSSWQSASITTNVVIATSNQAVSPTVSISAPSTIGACDSLTLDISGSSGNGGRPWLSRTIQVETTATANVSDLQHFLTHKYQASPPTAIPAALVSKGFAYNFVVTLCNFLGKCSQSSKSVLALDRTLPTVSLPGTALRTTSRSSALTIGSDAYFVLCGSTVQVRSGLSYSWTVSTGGAVLISATSTSKDPSKFVLAPYNLEVGKMYDILLKVTIAATAQSASAAVQVFVQPSSIFAVPALGTSRTVRVEESLTIDASGSYDEDQAGVTGQRAGLVYSWSCVQVQPIFSDACSSAFTVTSGSANVQAFSMEARSTAEDAVVQVTLTIFDASFARTARSVITVTVLPSLSPVVTVSSNIPSSGIFNSNRELQLTGTVAFPASFNGTAVWSVDDTSNFNFATAVKSPISLTFLPSATLQSSTIYLVIAANTLPGRSTLTFSLTAHVPLAGLQTVSSVSVAVNAPPLPGTFMVTPANGTEIVDTFSFQTSEWYDADLPLLYQFAYVSSSGAEVTVRSKQQTAFGSSVLPAGLAAHNFSVTCVVGVFDLHSAFTNAMSVVNVFKMSNNTSFNRNDLIQSGLSEGASSVDGLKQATSLGSYLLNEVDCSAAPDCVTLNRHACYRTANTCGECLSSAYVGDSGDSNTACKEITPGFSAATAFHVCNSTGQCVSELKTCAGNCSFPQGSCIFVHADTAVEVPSCYVGATGCNAVCDCTEGFIGSDTCSLNSTQLLEKQALRSQVIRGIQDLVSLEDADQDTVTGWIGSVVSAAQTPDELSEEGITSLLDTVETVISSAAGSGVSADVLGTVLRSVDASVQASVDQVRRRRRLTRDRTNVHASRLLQEASSQLNSTLLRAEDILALYRSVVSDSMLPGQDAVTMLLPQFRVLVQKLSLLGSSSATALLSAPVSPLERLNGQVANSISVPAVGAGQASLDVSLTTLRSELYNTELSLSGSAQVFSSPLAVELAGVECTADDSCRFEVVLQTSAAMSGLAAVKSEEARFNTSCTANDVSVHSYVCPDDSIVTAECPGYASTVVSRCPVTSYIPTCNSIAGLDVTSSGCQGQSFTATTVTCSCPLQAFASRRKLQSSADGDDATGTGGEVSVSYVAMLSEVKDNFVQTVLSAQGLDGSTIERGWSALVTVGTLAIAIVFGLFWSHHADKVAEQVKPDLKAKIKSVGAVVKLKQLAKRARERVKYTVDKDVKIAEQALPAILSSNTIANRVKGEIKQHHKWFGIFFYFSRTFPRVLRVLSLATNIIIMLFIQAITYSLTNPDDGLCETYSSKSECLAPSSPYATGDSKCFWNPETSKCALVQPDGNMKVILFVAIFSALVSTPFALLVDHLILHVLAAPTKEVDEHAVRPSSADALVPGISGANLRPRGRSTRVLTSIVPEEPVTNLVGVGRQRSNKRSTSMRSGFGSLLGFVGDVKDNSEEKTIAITAHSDLRKLIEELHQYRATLSSENKVEFDAIWGLDENGSFKSDEESRGTVGRMLGMFPVMLRSQRNSAAAQTGSVSQRVLSDLKSVHRSLRSEREMATTFDSSKAEKGRRLLFLFQRDLLPGISGKILESKGNRDNLTAKRVSWETKLAGWVFIGALNVGMLFYILLFALSQTVHRQGAWAMSFVLWLVVEILFVSSATVVLTHILLPSLIMKDVSKIKRKLVESIRAFNSGVRNGRDRAVLEGPEHFNAAEYLFVSTRLAKEWPDLREAQIIALFRSPWPKQSYQRESNVSKSYSKKYSALVRSASIIAIFFLTQLLQVPPGLQDMIVQTVTTVTVGYTVLIHLQLFYIFPVLVIVPALIVGVIVHFWIQSNKANEKLRLAKLFPVSPNINQTSNNASQSMKSIDLPTMAIALPQENSHEEDSDWESDSSSEPTYGDIDLESGPDSDHRDTETQLHLPLGSQLVGAEPPKGHTTRRQSVQHGLRVLETLQRAQDHDVSAQSASKNGIACGSSDSEESDSQSSVNTAEEEKQEYGEVVTVLPTAQQGHKDFQQDNSASSSSSQSAPTDVPRRPFSALRSLSENPRTHFILSSSSEEEAEEDEGVEEGSDNSVHSAKSIGNVKLPHPLPSQHQRPHTSVRDRHPRQATSSARHEGRVPSQLPVRSQGPVPAQSAPLSTSERSSELPRCRSISLSEAEYSGSEEEDPHDGPFRSDQSENDFGDDPHPTGANNDRSGW